MSQLVTAAEVVATGARHQMAVVRAHPLFFIGGVVQPAALMTVMFLARGQPSGAGVTAVASAVVLMAYWGSTVWQGAAILRRERLLGTLAASVRGLHDPMLVLVGKALGASLAPAALILLTVAGMLVLFDARIQVAAPVWFVVGLVAALLSGTALGTMLCSLFLLTRYGPQLSSALLYPVYLLAGLLIPPGLFPAWISALGWPVSLRWAQEFLVSAAAGKPDFAAFGLMALLTTGYAVCGVLAFRRVDRLARERGTLELG
jgi:ABC-2 type transport system permease protein